MRPRSDRSSTWVGLRPSPGIIAVLVTLTAAFILLKAAATPEMLQHLVLIPRRALGPEPWQLVTNVFVHVRFGTLLSAAIGIWLFGTPVEQQAGRGALIKLL